MARKKSVNKKQRPAAAATKKKVAKERQKSAKDTGGSLGLRAPLLHGRAISAQEFELEVGRVFSVEQEGSGVTVAAKGL